MNKYVFSAVVGLLFGSSVGVLGTIVVMKRNEVSRAWCYLNPLPQNYWELERMPLYYQGRVVTLVSPNTITGYGAMTCDGTLRVCSLDKKP